MDWQTPIVKRGRDGYRRAAAPVDRAVSRAEWVVLTALIAVGCGALVMIGPFGTNDGPAHMSFARTLWFGFEGPLQDHVYAVRRSLDPNLLGYLIAGPFIPLLGADWTEIGLQALCLAALPMAGLFVARSFFPVARCWLVALFALSLNEMFFLGLYNYSLSLSVGLVAFGTLVRAERDGGRWWPLFALALVVTFLAHAGGLVMAFVFAAAWLVPRFVMDVVRRAGGAVLLRRYGPALLAMLPVALLALQFAIRQGHAEMARGIVLRDRIEQTFRLQVLAANGVVTIVAAQALALVIVAGTVIAARERLRLWPSHPESRLTTVRFALMIAGGLVLVAAFPDVAGGGWTHVHRMILLPSIAAIMVCAVHHWTMRSRAIVLASAGACCAVLLGAAIREQVPVYRARVEIDRLLARVGEHCTVLPLVYRPYEQANWRPPRFISPLYAAGSRTGYAPLAQLTMRVEQRGDRVSLFNFLARLRIYPVVNRDGIDPEGAILGWPAGYKEGNVERADPAAFERATGVAVDYVLLQAGADEAGHPGLADATRTARLIAGSESGGFRLYARASPNGCRAARFGGRSE